MTQTSSTLFYTVWLLCNDEEFLRLNAETPVDVFPRGSSRFLAGLALSNWKQYQVPLSRAVVELATENDTAALRRAGATRDQAREVYDDLSIAYAVAKPDLLTLRAVCHEWLERRRLLVAMAKAEDSISGGDLKAARVHLSSSAAPPPQIKPVTISPSSPDFLAKLRQPKPGAIPLGFSPLDNAWEGGYRPGELGMIVASTGVGKSMGLCYMAAEAAWAGALVAYHTFELTPEQIRERVALAMLHQGRLNTHEEWDVELRRAALRRGFNNPPVFDIDIRNDCQSWPLLGGYLENFKRQWSRYPDVLLLDSADDIAPLSPREKTHEQLKDAFTHLRLNIAEGKQVRVWTSGQLNRDAVAAAVRGSRINLRHIGDAFAKAQRSHYVLGFMQTDADANRLPEPAIQLYVLKDSLHGTTGGHLTLTAKFGHGNNGYPGFSVDESEYLPSI